MPRVAPCGAQRETRLTCRDMVNGLLCELDDHNYWTVAEAAGHASPYRMQHLLFRARVEGRQLPDAAADWAAAHITAGQDEDEMVMSVDETADEKSSSDCAGRPASTAAPPAVSRCARSRSPWPARPRPVTR